MTCDQRPDSNDGAQLSRSPSSAKPLGAKVLALAEPDETRSWMPRRLERVRLITERVIEREVTCYLNLAAIPEECAPVTASGTLVLPLLLLERAAHVVITAEGSDGRELDRPVRATERGLIAEGLSHKWTKPLSGNCVDQFEHIISASAQPIPRAAEWWGARPDGDELLGACLADAKEVLSSFDEVLDLAEELKRWQRSFLMLVELPASTRRSEVQIVKLRYEETVPTFAVVEDGRINLRALPAAAKKLVGGSLSSSLRIPAIGLGDGRSSHVAVDAPPGFRVVDAALRVVEVKGGVQFQTWVRDDDRLSTSAHVYLDTKGRSFRDIEFVCNFYSYKSGFFMESL